MIYRLPEIISKEAIFYQILPDLNKQYRYLKENDHTAVSLIQTKRINSNALPLFIGMLNLMENRSHYPVYLELAYNPKFLAFLNTIGFFSELSNYGIIEYFKDYLIDLPDYNYNKENKILLYSPYKFYEDYYKKRLKEERREIRDLLAEEIKDLLKKEIRLGLYNSSIFNIEKTPIKNDELWNTTMTAVTELIVNAIIHSGSMSYAYIQSGISFTNNRKGYLISIVDVGKGFYKSLGEKIKECDEYTQKQRENFYQHAQTMGIDVTKELNFLSIMEALFCSQLQPRDMDLYKLKNLLAMSHANFRIHHYNREVAFSYERCSRCVNRDILHCVGCIWERRKKQNSPLKNYPLAMAGVHVEVEFIRENKYV